MTTPFSGPEITSISSCIGNSSLMCDALVTKACVGSNSISCACVNSPVPCATTSYSLCSNNPNAYKPTNVTSACNAPVACTNTVSAGTNTLIDESIQICSAEQPIVFNTIYIVMFIVVVGLLTIITTFIFVWYTTGKLVQTK